MRVDACGCVWMRVDACGCEMPRHLVTVCTLQRARCGLQVEDPPLCDWSAARLAPLRDAMCDPALYMEALAALGKLCSRKRGENETHPAYIARCASLVAAVDWIAFVLHVAGQDVDVASRACRVLTQASFGLRSLSESMQPLLRAVAPALAAMQTHKGNLEVVQSAARFFKNVSLEAPLRSKLRELGVLDAVREVGKSHPEDALVQARLGNYVKHLVQLLQ